MINLFVANTDNSWFDFLGSEHDLKEVVSGGREKRIFELSSRARFWRFD